MQYVTADDALQTLELVESALRRAPAHRRRAWSVLRQALTGYHQHLLLPPRQVTKLQQMAVLQNFRFGCNLVLNGNRRATELLTEEMQAEVLVMALLNLPLPPLPAPAD